LQRTLSHNAQKRAARAQTGRGVPPVLLGVAGLTGVLVLLPLAYLILRAFEADGQNLREIVFRARTLELLGNTLALTAGVLVGSSLLALPLAWLLARTDLPAKRLTVLLGVLPLAVPGYVGAFAMLGATGPNGVIHVLTGIDFPRPVGYWGAVGVLSLFSFPYLFLNVWAALRGLDPNIEEVARSLGHSRLRVFSSVILPQLRPALYAGGLMIALHVLGDFGVVSLVRFETFSAAIYTQYTASFDRVYAAWLSLMLLALTTTTLVLEARLLSRVQLSRVGSGAARRQTMIRLGAWRWPSLAFVLALGVASLGVPVLTVAYWLGRGQLSNAALEKLGEALLNSISAAAPAAILCALLALPLAYLGVRFPNPSSRWLERVAYLGNASPPLALALALVFFTLRSVPFLYQTLALLVIAYAIHFLAEAIGPIRSALYQAPPKLEEAARGLGFKPIRAFLRVTLPLIQRGLFSSLALVFVSSLKELPIGMLLSPIGFDTLAKRIFGFTSEAMFAEAAPYALTIMLAGSVFAVIVLNQRERT
jgi:iron(III) transport system permease protein